jgi:predicted nucleic acid-binding protein
MGMKYLYDTNVFVYYLADEETVAKLFSATFLQKNQVIISSIVKIELLSYPELTEEEDVAIRDLLSQFEKVPLMSEIEEIAISLKRQRRIKLPDAILAATAIHVAAYLVTRNTADFRNVDELQVYNPWD